MTPKNENLPVSAPDNTQDGGTITYANEVIAIIAGVAANEIEGLAGMCTSGGLGDIISKNRNITRGVKVELGTEEVSVDLYTIVEYGQPIQKVAGEVQENVRKNIEAMTGLKVVSVDVHVQGVSFEKEKREVQQSLSAASVPTLTESATNKESTKKHPDEESAKKDVQKESKQENTSDENEKPEQVKQDTGATDQENNSEARAPRKRKKTQKDEKQEENQNEKA